MKEENLIQSLKKILMKKAKGYMYKEEVEEYEKQQKEKKPTQTVSEQLDFSSLDIDFKSVKKVTKKEMTLIKKKISSHYVPPDLAAIKMLLDYFVKDEDGEDITKLSEEELEKLKVSLIDQLKNL